jgi:hypothetical protein
MSESTDSNSFFDDIKDGALILLETEDTVQTSVAKAGAIVHAALGYIVGGMVTRNKVAKAYDLNPADVKKETTVLGFIPA